jgi:hypothetical protein
MPCLRAPRQDFHRFLDREPCQGLTTCCLGLGASPSGISQIETLSHGGRQLQSWPRARLASGPTPRMARAVAVAVPAHSTPPPPGWSAGARQQGLSASQPRSLVKPRPVSSPRATHPLLKAMKRRSVRRQRSRDPDCDQHNPSAQRIQATEGGSTPRRGRDPEHLASLIPRL